ncbi:tyrosine-type recombinase/integrase [Paracoccaceae bacterium GXU_MW_L88]
MKRHLTELAIKQLPFEKRGSVKYWDTVQKGFGVRVSQSAKSYFVMYGERRQLHTIGAFGSVSLSDARKEARRYIDHVPTKKRLELTTEALTAYLKECVGRLKPKTVAMYRHNLKTRHKYISDIKRADINLTNPYEVASWKAFFNWCIKNDIIDRNPLQFASAVTRKRDRVLTIGELKAIYGYHNPPFSDHVKLLLLTGMRRSEPSHVEVQNDLLIVPPEHTKNGKPLVTPYLPPMTVPVPFNGWSKAKTAMDTVVPLPHWTLHDLRRTFATIHAQLGTPIHVVEALLNHVSGEISGLKAIYIRHNFLAEAKTAQLRYIDHLQKEGVVPCLSG